MLTRVFQIIMCTSLLSLSTHIRASSCSFIQNTHKILSEHSLYFQVLSASSHYHSNLINSFLKNLDPWGLYLLENHTHYITTQFHHHLNKDGDFVENVCNAIESSRSVYNARVDTIKEAIPELLTDPMLLLDKAGKDQTKHLRLQVDHTIPPATTIKELYERWKKWLLYERYKFFRHTHQTFLVHSEKYYAKLHSQLQSTDHMELAFAHALTAVGDIHTLPKREFFFEHPNRKIRIFPESYSEDKHYIFHINAALRLPYIFTEWIDVISPRFLRYAMGVNDYHNLGIFDKVINFIDYTYDDNEFLYLRHGKHEYTFDRLIPTPSFLNTFSLFSCRIPTFPKTQTVDHIPKNKKDTVSSSIIYIHAGQLDRSSKAFDVDRLSKEISYILDTQIGASPVFNPISTAILDLRGSRIIKVHYAISFLEAFLPNQPVMQLQDIHSNIIPLSTGTPKTTFSGGLIILVNRTTSQHAEMIAATLQEHGRAIILGEGLGHRTAGNSARLKGFPKGAKNSKRLVVSDSLVYTPTGKILEGYGVKPDFSLPAAREGENTYYDKLRIKDPLLLKRFLKNIPAISGFKKKTVRKDIIDILKKRSYKRLLKKRVPTSIFRGRNHVITKHLPFEDVYYINAQDLSEERSWRCSGPFCGTVSLNFHKFSEHMQKASYRNNHMQSMIKHHYISEVSRGKNFMNTLKQQDLFLSEAILIAADYDHILRGLALEDLRLPLSSM